nr:MAG TPA: hypothetical protein [Bacteriophage sp.]
MLLCNVFLTKLHNSLQENEKTLAKQLHLHYN